MVGLAQSLYVKDLIAVLQLNGDADRTNTVAVVIVHPNLGHGDLSLIGLMGVGNSEAEILTVLKDAIIVGIFHRGNRDLIALGNVGLHDGVLDLLTVGVFIQIGPGVLPVVCSAQDLSTHNGHAVHQLNGNALIADAVLVVGVFPLLLNADRSLLDCVGVSDGVAESIARVKIVRDNGSVCLIGILIQDFLDGVVNGLAALILGQTSPGILPAIGCLQSLAQRISIFIHGLYTISQKLDSDLIGTHTVLIIIVDPNLLNADRGLFPLIAVDDFEAGGSSALKLLGIKGFTLFIHKGFTVSILEFELIHSIDDLYALITILRQIVPSRSPTILSIQGDRIQHLYISGALSLLTLRGSRSLSDLFIKLDLDRSRTLCVAIIVIVPDLLDGNCSLLRLISIRDNIIRFLTLGDYRSILRATGKNLFDLILDFLALHGALILGQAGPLMGPTIGCVQSDNATILSGNGNVILQQLDLHTGVTDTILVISVGPFLLNRNGSFHFVGVSDGVAESTIVILAAFGIIGGITTIGPGLLHGILDSIALDAILIVILGQVFPGILPVIAVIQGHSSAHGSLVGGNSGLLTLHLGGSGGRGHLIELDLDLIVTETIFVVVVIPDLLHGDFGALDVIADQNSIAGSNCNVAILNDHIAIRSIRFLEIISNIAVYDIAIGILYEQAADIDLAVGVSGKGIDNLIFSTLHSMEFKGSAGQDGIILAVHLDSSLSLVIKSNALIVFDELHICSLYLDGSVGLYLSCAIVSAYHVLGSILNRCQNVFVIDIPVFISILDNRLNFVVIKTIDILGSDNL